MYDERQPTLRGYPTTLCECGLDAETPRLSAGRSGWGGALLAAVVWGCRSGIPVHRDPAGRVGLADDLADFPYVHAERAPGRGSRVVGVDMLDAVDLTGPRSRGHRDLDGRGSRLCRGGNGHAPDFAPSLQG